MAHLGRLAVAAGRGLSMPPAAAAACRTIARPAAVRTAAAGLQHRRCAATAAAATGDTAPRETSVQRLRGLIVGYPPGRAPTDGLGRVDGHFGLAAPTGGPAAEGQLRRARYNASTAHLHLTYKGVDELLAVPTLWLRDACTCTKCVAPSSGQKAFHTHDLALHPAVDTVEVVRNTNSLRVTWHEGDSSASTRERHRSVYDAKALLYRLAGLAPPAFPVLPPARLWDRATIERVLRPVAYADWMATDGADAGGDGGGAPEFYRGLTDLFQLGLVVVDGVPDSETAVRDIANRIGNIQTTFYGELFDVVSKADAENVAYTNVFLCLHQDLLYMNDPPYIQLLHCLRNDCDGGESLFSDSLRAAVEMQMRRPGLAQALADVDVPYHYERNGHYYYNKRPVLELQPPEDDGRGLGGVKGPRAARDGAGSGSGSANAGSRLTLPVTRAPIKLTGWSPPFQDIFGGLVPRMGAGHAPERTAKTEAGTEPRSAKAKTTPFGPAQPLSFQGHFVHGDSAGRLAYWHEAAAHFSGLLDHADNLFEFKLQPGQCVLFNNRRVLHGRRQFNTGTGSRWLKGAYIDEQTFKSRVMDMVRRGRYVTPVDAVAPAPAAGQPTEAPAEAAADAPKPAVPIVREAWTPKNGPFALSQRDQLLYDQQQVRQMLEAKAGFKKTWR